jgi:hypothetical protein
MNSPRVIELPRRLEPVVSDPFLDRAVGEVVTLRPRSESDERREPAPRPPRRAA